MLPNFSRTRLKEGARALFVAAPLAMLAAPAAAHVTISSGATENMSCGGGVCAPTAQDAVLNAGDLETLLASGNAEVTTTGSDVEANDIAVKAELTWSTAAALALDAHRVISVSKKIAVAGPGGLSLTTDGRPESLSFRPKGKVTFANLSGSLAVNGTAYMLKDTISSFAAAIAADPSGATTPFSTVTFTAASGNDFGNNDVIAYTCIGYD